MTGNRKPITKANRKHGFIVQPRDKQILQEVGIMRVAERAHVKAAAGFGSTTRVNTRLLALTRAKLLRRWFLGSGGGRKAIYALSEKGAQFIDVPYIGLHRRKDEVLVADFFVQHQLSINNLYCNLKFGKIPEPNVRFKDWQAFHKAITPDIALIPDGYVEFTTPIEIDCSFIEVDLGHESLAIWKKKAVHYVKLALSEEFTKQFKQPRFRVLVMANTERRLNSIRAAIATVTQKIFWFATLDGVRGEQFFGSVWLLATGDEQQRFLN